MAVKKYNEFPAGTYDPAKILLQADPVTGELEKIELGDVPGQKFGSTDNENSANRAFDMKGFPFKFFSTYFGHLFELIMQISGGGVPSFRLSQRWSNYQSYVTLDSQKSDFYHTDGANISRVTYTPTSLNMAAPAGTSNEIIVTPSAISIWGEKLRIPNLPAFANNTDALAGGLSVNSLYHASGVVMIVL